MLKHRLKTFLIAVALSLTALSALSAVPASAAVAFPPALRVGLEPQGGLEVSKRFPGFEDDAHKVSVTILELPGRAYEELQRSVFNPQQSGLAQIKRESFPFASGIGFLISGAGEDNGIKLQKWFLLASGANGEDMAVLVSVQVPEAARAIYTDELVRKILASMTFRPAPIDEQLAMMPFKINDMAGFRVLQVLPQGGVVLADGPSDDMSKTTYAVVSVGAPAPEEPDERARFARQLLDTAPLRAINVTNSEPMRIGGLQGYEIRGQAEGPRGEAVNLAQWVRFGSGGYMRVIGVGPRDTWDGVFTRLRAIRDGVTMR